MLNQKRGIRQVCAVALAAGLSLFVQAARAQDASEQPALAAETYVPTIVTGDIQAGIEKHIAGETRRGGGYFTVPFEGKQLKLKLVRVHIEYLASLAPRRHFACVDMASADGQFYDIDFFLEGEPGAMTVTETTVHKLNGKPYYVWKQNEDKRWVRAAVEDASQELLGVRTAHDAFEFRYQATLPEFEGSAQCWIPIAQSDDVRRSPSDPSRCRAGKQILVDRAYGNRVLFLELGPDDSGKTIEIVYDVERIEKGRVPMASG